MAFIPSTVSSFLGNSPQYASICSPTKNSFKAKNSSVTMAQKFDVEIEWKGKKHNFKAEEGQNLLEVMEENSLFVDNSCRAGVCITCAARILEGEVDQSSAALAPEVESKGFILTCCSYPVKGPIKLKMEQFDAAYDMQYGQYEQKEQQGGLLSGLFGKK